MLVESSLPRDGVEAKSRYTWFKNKQRFTTDLYCRRFNFLHIHPGERIVILVV